MEEQPQIDFNPEDIDEEIAVFTGDLNRVGRALAEASREMALAKLNLERVEARLKLEVKHQAEVRGQRMTEKVMEATVRNLDSYHQANLAYIEAVATRDRLRADARTLDGKERMIDLVGRKRVAEIRYVTGLSGS